MRNFKVYFIVDISLINVDCRDGFMYIPLLLLVQSNDFQLPMQ